MSRTQTRCSYCGDTYRPCPYCTLKPKPDLFKSGDPADSLISVLIKIATTGAPKR